LKDGFGTAKPLLTDEEAQAALMTYSGEVRKKRRRNKPLLPPQTRKLARRFSTPTKPSPAL